MCELNFMSAKKSTKRSKNDSDVSFLKAQRESQTTCPISNRSSFSTTQPPHQDGRLELQLALIVCCKMLSFFKEFLHILFYYLVIYNASLESLKQTVEPQQKITKLMCTCYDVLYI